MFLFLLIVAFALGLTLLETVDPRLRRGFPSPLAPSRLLGRPSCAWEVCYYITFACLRVFFEKVLATLVGDTT